MNELTAIERQLEHAQLWGLEMDPTYRVVAATFIGTGEDDDTSTRPVQLLLHPVSVILASLHSNGALMRFDAEQLVDVSRAFGGARPELPIFGRPEPRPGAWSTPWSLEGRSHAPDGRRHTATLRVTDGDDTLAVFIRFDIAELRDESGAEIETSEVDDAH